MLSGLLTLLHVGWGTITAVLVYFFFIKAWLLRERILWAWLGSIILLGVSFIIGQLTLAYKFYTAFSRIGPCSICYEWSGFPFLFYLFGWGVGLLVFLIISGRATAKLIQSGGQLQSGLPRRALIWFIVIAVLIVSAGILAIRLPQQQRASLADRVQNMVPLPTLNGLFFTHLGYINLPWTPNQAWNGHPPYAESGSLHLSPDNKWLTVAHGRNFEVWDRDYAPALQIELPRYDHLIRSAFSPDSSQLAVWNHTRLEVYSLNKKPVTLSWQVELKVYHYVALTFDEDGEKIILVIPNEVRVYDALTGTLLEQNALPKVEGYIQIAFNAGATRIVRWHNKTVVVFTRAGQELNRWPTNVELDYFPAHQRLLFFTDDQHLMFIHPYSGAEDLSAKWNLETGEAFTFPVNASGGSLVAFSPDGQLMLTSGYGGSFRAWETTGFTEINTISTTAAITDLIFSPDQNLLVIATADGKIHFYTGVFK